MGKEYVWVGERWFRWGRRETACGTQAAEGSCSTAGAAPRPGLEKPRRPLSRLGKICCCEKKSCLWLFESYCAYESRVSILFYIKRIASKIMVSAINIFTWKKT